MVTIIICLSLKLSIDTLKLLLFDRWWKKDIGYSGVHWIFIKADNTLRLRLIIWLHKLLLWPLTNSNQWTACHVLYSPYLHDPQCESVEDDFIPPPLLGQKSPPFRAVPLVGGCCSTYCLLDRIVTSSDESLVYSNWLHWKVGGG